MDPRLQAGIELQLEKRAQQEHDSSLSGVLGQYFKQAAPKTQEEFRKEQAEYESAWDVDQLRKRNQRTAENRKRSQRYREDTRDWTLAAKQKFLDWKKSRGDSDAETAYERTDSRDFRNRQGGLTNADDTPKNPEGTLSRKLRDGLYTLSRHIGNPYRMALGEPGAAVDRRRGYAGTKQDAALATEIKERYGAPNPFRPGIDSTYTPEALSQHISNPYRIEPPVKYH